MNECTNNFLCNKIAVISSNDKLGNCEMVNSPRAVFLKIFLTFS